MLQFTLISRVMQHKLQIQKGLKPARQNLDHAGFSGSGRPNTLLQPGLGNSSRLRARPFQESPANASSRLGVAVPRAGERASPPV